MAPTIRNREAANDSLASAQVAAQHVFLERTAPRSGPIDDWSLWKPSDEFSWRNPFGLGTASLSRARHSRASGKAASFGGRGGSKLWRVVPLFQALSAAAWQYRNASRVGGRVSTNCIDAGSAEPAGARQ